MAPRYVPDRGDVVWLRFDPQAGHEQSGKRPALVVSPKAYNQKSGLALVCPITSTIKGYPFEVVLPEKGTTRGAVLSDQIKSLDWRVRKARKISKAEKRVMGEILAKIHTLIGE